MNILDNKYLFDGSFGLERETLRVDENGALAKTPHPFPGSKYFDKDFCENQLELITPVCGSIESLMEELISLDSHAKCELKKNNEYLWFNSNPPHINSEEDIIVAKFSGDESFKHEYRLNLKKRYGKRLMLYSGVHFNFSFSDNFIRSISPGDYNTVRTALYFKLHKYLCRYSWLLVLLTAASPVYDLSLDGDGLSGDGFDGYGSRRGSEIGYWNKFVPVLDYTNLRAYTKSVEAYIKSGALFSAGELYLPVRMKPRGENSLNSLNENGIDHIELRMFDLNPLSSVGIMREDLEFAHCFMIYLITLPEFYFTAELQKTAIENHKSAAKFKPDFINGYNAVDAALGLLEDIRLFFKGTQAENVITVQIDKIKNDNRTCIEVYRRFREGFHEKTLTLSKNMTIQNGGIKLCSEK